MLVLKIFVWVKLFGELPPCCQLFWFHDLTGTRRVSRVRTPPQPPVCIIAILNYRPPTLKVVRRKNKAKAVTMRAMMMTMMAVEVNWPVPVVMSQLSSERVRIMLCMYKCTRHKRCKYRYCTNLNATKFRKYWKLASAYNRAAPCLKPATLECGVKQKICNGTRFTL